jgi:hypothetical protein
MATVQYWWALVYKAENVFYKNGQNCQIGCNFQYIGDNYGINTNGEVTVLATSVPTEVFTSPPTEVIVPAVATPPGQAWPSATQFSDTAFKPVVQVKDMNQQVTYYIDYASYYANVIQCNPIPNNVQQALPQ